MIDAPTHEQVRAARQAGRHTQAQAAALIFVTRRAWAYWESGQRQMSTAEWELYLMKTGQHPEYPRG